MLGSFGFDDWVAKVDALVGERAGCSLYDLPDVPLRDWYAEEVSPKIAAARAIRGARS